MTLKHAAKDAVHKFNPPLAARVCDCLRFKYNLNYDAVQKLIQEWTGCTEANWEDLLYEAEALAAA